ncbi:MAG: hypothetical protein M3Q39_09870 [Actinomycetota bacterium]|nr:hypothetical protein [Actinomycetota bacterium]
MASLFTVGGRPRADIADAVAIGGLALVAAYLGLLSYGLANWRYESWMLLVLMPFLMAVGFVIINAVTRLDDDPIRGLLVVAMAAKLGAAFVRYFVTFSLYGYGDASLYDERGTEIANAFHNGELSLGELVAFGQGTQFMRGATGFLYTLMGPTRLGGFVVFSWIGFWGLFLFYRALLIGCPEANHRRYALGVFLLPSLLFWPSSIGKEAVMMLALGLCAYGSARLLERRSLWWPTLLAGLGLCYVVRPHVAVVVLGALAVAVAFRRSRSSQATLGPFGRLLMVGIVAAGMSFVFASTVDRFLPTSEETGLGAAGQLLEKAEYGTSTEETQSELRRENPEESPDEGTPTVNSPLEYPEAVLSVLFRPWLFEARTAGDVVAALETTAVLLLAVLSWRRLKALPAIMFRRTYVLFCVVYAGIFTFAWSSFANVGALARQRSQLWPIVFVLLAVPPARDMAAARKAEYAQRSTYARPPRTASHVTGATSSNQ